MGVPLGQIWSVTSHILKQKMARRRRYPLVLMLEPLFRCNLACAGCGKIQYPPHILNRELSFDQIMQAVDDCPTPVISILGGEPLLHSDIERIITELIRRKKYIYFCTNAVLLGEHLHRFKPSKYLNWSIHLDGAQEQHDFAVCKDGVYADAIEAIQHAVARGFRVTTNTTLFEGVDPNAVRGFFDSMMELGVEGMMISPGYAYEKAPDKDKDHFLKRAKTQRLFRMLLSNRHLGKQRWVFNQSPLFLDFLMGKTHFDCTPWGNPTFNIFGWQKPCYLLQDGYTETYQELLDETDWSQYAASSKDPRCANCMVHCGHEPSAVDQTFSGVRGMLRTIRSMMNRDCKDSDALRALEAQSEVPHGPLIQIGVNGYSADKDELSSESADIEDSYNVGPRRHQTFSDYHTQPSDVTQADATTSMTTSPAAP